ncbi:hypothetical protein [Ponticaulis sp.]|uniref:hypothetical protein n=1 Tax=Ponticaulis sp. TaxID=2020902 RepID=UPI0025DEB10F|nr:hypothetical protein [Ponticaulis sp.]|tara:strand:+ start:7981 stop:8142 length:162 start_codon:yes stop_codon:yes gene_type:complete
MDKKKAALLALMLAGFSSLGGCVAAAVAGAYVVGEELNENDGDFDPLDEIVDG